MLLACQPFFSIRSTGVTAIDDERCVGLEGHFKEKGMPCVSVVVGVTLLLVNIDNLICG